MSDHDECPVCHGMDSSAARWPTPFDAHDLDRRITPHPLDRTDLEQT